MFPLIVAKAPEFTPFATLIYDTAIPRLAPVRVRLRPSRLRSEAHSAQPVETKGTVLLHATSDIVRRPTLDHSLLRKRPLRVGVISNPDSGQNRRGLQPIKALLAHYREVLHREARDPAELDAALQEFAHQGVELLVINGGDGTVQATLTILFDRHYFNNLPFFAVLAGGTTNMTAGDIGVTGSAKRGLARVLSWAHRPGEHAAVASRSVLRIQRATDTSPLHGMFFGAGAIIQGIDYCHRRIHGLGFRSGVAPGICTLRMLADMVRSTPKVVAPFPVTVAFKNRDPSPERRPQESDLLLLLASTLERLFLGIRPYWGHERGELYYTAIRFRPTHALRTLPFLFWDDPIESQPPRMAMSATRLTSYS